MIHDILIIQGIVITDIEMRVLIGNRFVELWEAYKSGKYDDFMGFWMECTIQHRSVTDIISEKIGLNVYTWPCCSPLNTKKFVIGEKVGKISLSFDKCKQLPDIPDLAQSIGKKGRRYGLDGDVVTITIADDCMYCS